MFNQSFTDISVLHIFTPVTCIIFFFYQLTYILLKILNYFKKYLWITFYCVIIYNIQLYENNIVLLLHHMTIFMINVTKIQKTHVDSQ